MLNVDELRTLFSYMFWGDRAILAAAKSVPAENYHRELGISAGSVHKLLAHCLGAQVIWLERWRGRSFGGAAG